MELESIGNDQMNLDGDGDKTGASANAACAVHSSELSLRTYPEFQGFCACECPHLFAVGALVAPTVAKSAHRVPKENLKGNKQHLSGTLPT